MIIRIACQSDLDAIAYAEGKCFPPEEAAGKNTFCDRLCAYRKHFLLMCDTSRGGLVCGFIDGFVTDERTIRDEMFADAALHNENGAWKAIFGVATLPEYQKQGIASALMEYYIERARSEGRLGCILTCKEALLPFYSRFGYKNEGISRSVHGGAVWYDMRLTF